MSEVPVEPSKLSVELLANSRAATCASRISLVSWCFVQGYLAHKKHPSRRTLQ